MMMAMMMTFSQVEMDSIVDQMMSVAEMLGWETNELRPVFMMMMVMMIMIMFGMCCQNTI